MENTKKYTPKEMFEILKEHNGEVSDETKRRLEA